jgi:hypothetical protein
LFLKKFFWANGFTSKIFGIYVSNPTRSISSNKLAKNGQTSPFELFRKGRKRRFTAGLVFVSVFWDLPASVQVNFKRKNAVEFPKPDVFADKIFLLVRSKRSSEWRLSTAFQRRLE